jgi:hypothetical protein
MSRLFEASLTYYDGISDPTSYMEESAIPPGSQRTFSTKDLSYNFHDMRELSAKEELSLDVNGFQLVHHHTSLSPTDFYQAQKVTKDYYAEMEQFMLKHNPGATRAIIFDHNVRSAELDLYDAAERYSKEGESQVEKITPTGPVRFVHNDFTHRSGPLRVQALTKGAGKGGSYTQSEPLLTEAEAQSILERRFAIVQAWRPINHPVTDTPLAVCDARSVEPIDLVESHLVYPDRIGYTYILSPNAAHRWYFVPKMARKEVLLFKCYDSQLDGRARFTAHSAFEVPEPPAGAPPRESIEIRALLVYGDEHRSSPLAAI